MNKANVLRVADAIERAELAPEFGFNMNYVEAARGMFGARDMTGKECGSIGCIAGWCVRLDGGSSYRHAFAHAQEWLDLDDGRADALFEPDVLENWQDITAEHAVRVLRHLAETGEVSWL
jgi:hypothetical protein